MWLANYLLPPGPRERFARWHRPIPALLDSAHEEAVLQHDTHELPVLPTYVSGNVAVLGDAAHAMTPNLGQGACQALEDAVTLAHAVDTLGVRAGLEAYDRTRRPRTQLIVRRSRQAGAAAHWTSTPLTTLRDAVLPLLPPGLTGLALTLRPGRNTLLHAAAILATPWLGMIGALLFPGTATYAPEFAGRTVLVLGLHGQVFMAIVLLAALLVATAATLRMPVVSATRS